MTTIPPPGPERDRLVAKAMGYQLVNVYEWEKLAGYPEDGVDYLPDHWPKGEFNVWHRPGDEGLPSLEWTLPRYSQDDGIFVRMCLPFIRSKFKRKVIEVLFDDREVIVTALAEGLREDDDISLAHGFGASLADAGTHFMLKAQDRGLL